MNISLLRSATANDHEAVERLVPLMDPHLEIETYAQVLSRIRDIVLAWERQLEVKAEGVVADLAEKRSRLSFIEDDLRELRWTQQSKPELKLLAFENQSQLLGAMYVMEGSRLGGQLIAKHVESCFGFERGHGTQYFRGFEERTAAMWKEFLETLQGSVPDDLADEVLIGAQCMFSAFASVMSEFHNSTSSVADEENCLSGK